MRDGPINDVTIRRTLDNLDRTSNHGIFVRADGSSTLNNIDISVTAEGFDEQAIRLLSGGAEQIANVNIHDCYFDVGLAAALTDGNGSFGPIRVTDCNMNTGSTSLSFDDTISKLYVHGNTAMGTIDDTGASQIYNEGNL